MKRCTLCRADIVPGVNGCTMYDTCISCKPIRYLKRQARNWMPLNITSMVSFEDLILERQEEYD